MNKKYKLVEQKFFPELNRDLWQIEAVADFGDVKKASVRKYDDDDPNSDYMLIMPLLRKKEAEWAKGKVEQ